MRNNNAGWEDLVSSDLSVWPIGEGLRLSQGDVYQLHADFCRAIALPEISFHNFKTAVYGSRVEQIGLGLEVYRLACRYVLSDDPSDFSQLSIYIHKHRVMPLVVLMNVAFAGLDVRTSYLCFRFALLEVPKGTCRFTEKNFRHLVSCAASLNRGNTLPERAPVSLLEDAA